MQIWIKYIILTPLLLLAACKSLHAVNDGPPKRRNIDLARIPNATPKAERRSRYGNPPNYTVLGKTYHVMKSSDGYHARGIASWYGTKFQNKRTSSGEPYDMFAMTAAHKSLPLPSYVKVTNLENGRSVIVKVNDRGPFHENRIIDLSYVAARKLGIVGKGTGIVELATLSPKQVTTPQPTQKPAHQPQLYLQIGAFSQRDNAEKLAQRIQQLTRESIHLENEMIGSQTIYRVQIGPLLGVGRSDVIHDTIKNAGIGDAITVIR